MDTALEVVTHIDVGLSRQSAIVLGGRETVVVLCGAKGGDRIRDDEGLIRAQGDFPAACNCPTCKRIARIMHDYDCGVQEARKRLEGMEAIT